ncbi:MAG: DUF3084 domain-containing protein [bacterium]
MSQFAGQVIILLIILGGFIAYSGNFVGKYIGKRRLVLFHLRPRHTANMITVFSGIMIAFLTLIILLTISQDARIAFLGLEKVKAQIEEKNKELKVANKKLMKMDQELGVKLNELEKAKMEIAKLNTAKTRLSREVSFTRLGDVVIKNGEIISVSLIKAGPDQEKIEDGLRQVIQNAGVKVTVESENFEAAVFKLLPENKLFVVRLVATRNILWGEAAPAKFEIIENRLIYKSGATIAKGDIPPKLSAVQLEKEITSVLRLSHQAALKAGVLPDTAGSLGGVPYSQIFDLAKKLKGQKKTVGLEIIASKDIYAIGPLEVGFKTGDK